MVSLIAKGFVGVVMIFTIIQAKEIEVQKLQKEIEAARSITGLPETMEFVEKIKLVQQLNESIKEMKNGLPIR
jgi:ubiquitin C-terminal hydrolase